MSATRHPAALVRLEVEGALAKRVPGALSPYVKTEPERIPCGIDVLDGALRGGIVLGAITELVGAECSGRTTTALAYTAASVLSGNVAAWVDVDDTLNPESAAMCGVDLDRLLWIRCGQTVASAPNASAPGVSAAAPPEIEETPEILLSAARPPAPQGGGSPHPRSEARGMAQAIQDLLEAQPRSGARPLPRRDKTIGTPGAPNRLLSNAALDREEQPPSDRLPPRRGGAIAFVPRRVSLRTASPGLASPGIALQDRQSKKASGSVPAQRNWTRLDQALRAIDLLLQSGGFGVIVLDLGSTPAEMAWRIPLATWFRFRAACERTHTALVLLTRHPCARSSAEVVARLQPGSFATQGCVPTGMEYRLELERQRFQRAPDKVIPIRKGPQSGRPGSWKGQAAWAL